MAEMFLITEHCREFGDDFLFQDRGGRASVHGMVVRIDQCCDGLRNPSHRVRGLKELADVLCIPVRIHVGQPFNQGGKSS